MGGIQRHDEMRSDAETSEMKDELAQSQVRTFPVAMNEKLSLLAFISILLVLLNHAVPLSLTYDGVLTRQPSSVAEFLLSFWQAHLGRVNRPLFFFISGFLFFWTIKPGWAGFVEKWRRRIKSLLVPYLVWSLLSCLFFVLCYWIPQTRAFIGSRMVFSSYSWREWLVVWLWNPYAYQLWYIRDLMLLVCLSPLSAFFATRLGWGLAAGIMVAWFADWLPSRPDEAGLTFFTLGVVLAKKRIIPDWDLRGWRWPCAVIWLLMCFANAVLAIDAISMPWVIKVANLFGMVAIWGLSDLLTGQLRQKMLKAATLTFFVYVAHEPLMLTLKKLAFKWVPYNGTTSLLAFILLPMTVLPICLMVGSLMRRHFPRLFSFLMGGRGREKSKIRPDSPLSGPL